MLTCCHTVLFLWCYRLFVCVFGKVSGAITPLIGKLSGDYVVKARALVVVDEAIALVQPGLISERERERERERGGGGGAGVT